jgi:D-arabinose 1-dehydrogenase-like Zn-dependent alcohol dehydrogenase
MKAMILDSYLPIEKKPLRAADLPEPVPQDNQILVSISVCGV